MRVFLLTNKNMKSKNKKDFWDKLNDYMKESKQNAFNGSFTVDINSNDNNNSNIKENNETKSDEKENKKEIDNVGADIRDEEQVLENGKKAETDVNGMGIQEVAIDNAQSWCPETGHPNGPSDSFAVRSFYWKNGVYDMEYRNGSKKQGVCTGEEAKDFAQAESKGRAQRGL